MSECIRPSIAHAKHMDTARALPIVAIALIATLGGVSIFAHTQTGSRTGSGTLGSQGFVLTDPNDLVIIGGTAETVE